MGSVFNLSGMAGTLLLRTLNWSVYILIYRVSIGDPIKILYYFFKIRSHFEKVVQNFELKRVGDAHKGYKLTSY